MKKCFVALLVFVLLIFLENISAERLEIQINKIKEDNFKFKIFLYDDENNFLEGNIEYVIENYYSDIIEKGNVDSGKEINFKLPKNPVQGPWKITAKYKNFESNQLFNVGDIEKADIKLEKDYLIIENIGNVPYDRNILIYIGQDHQTARMYLEVGQIKKIRLTAPEGVYTIRVDDGTEENKLTFDNVALTGNVVGLERVVEGNVFKRYPLISLFFGTIIITAIVIFVLKIRKKYIK